MKKIFTTLLASSLIFVVGIAPSSANSKFLQRGTNLKPQVIKTNLPSVVSYRATNAFRSFSLVLIGTSSSGLPVTFASGNSLFCPVVSTASGYVISANPGANYNVGFTCTLIASAPASATFAATSITQKLTVV